jgi:hypothetical protein
VLEDAAQIPAYRLAQDVAIEKILAALAATRDGLDNPPATPWSAGRARCRPLMPATVAAGISPGA